MITKETMDNLATRAFVVEEMIEAAYEIAAEVEQEHMGSATYRLRHLLYGASELAGNLAHSLSDSISDCPGAEERP